MERCRDFSQEDAPGRIPVRVCTKARGEIRGHILKYSWTGKKNPSFQLAVLTQERYAYMLPFFAIQLFLLTVLKPNCESSNVSGSFAIGFTRT